MPEPISFLKEVKSKLTSSEALASK